MRTLTPSPYQRHPERLLVFVAAIDGEHGYGCRACHRLLPAAFAGVYVATSATPGVSGQLHLVCSDECSRQVFNSFIQVGATAESWSGPRVRGWFNHHKLVAGVVGVRELSAAHGLVTQHCALGRWAARN